MFILRILIITCYKVAVFKIRKLVPTIYNAVIRIYISSFAKTPRFAQPKETSERLIIIIIREKTGNRSVLREIGERSTMVKCILHLRVAVDCYIASSNISYLHN